MPRGPDLFARWLSELRRAKLFHAGERVGAAVSGGPDSILLLEFMKQLAREWGLALAVVHFNHHLRGSESDADERFVRERARALGIEFLGGEADVGQAAREKHRNQEAIARELRYRFFFSLVNRGRLDKVATAHTANDQAETVLLRLLRGAGTRGLGGVYPALEGKIVRPFLSLTRAEIEAEIQKRTLDFRVDSTNLETRLRRNKIRIELLPLLEREFNPEVIGLLKELADRARDDEDFLEQQARERAKPWRVREPPPHRGEGAEEKIPVRALIEFPAAVERRVLRQMIHAVQGNLRGFAHRHIEALRKFSADAPSGRRLVLPGGLVARKEFDWLILGIEPSPRQDTEFSYPVEVPGEVAVSQVGLVFEFKIVGPQDLRKAYNDSGVGGLDRQKLSGKFVLRNWRPGDCFKPLGSRQAQKLKELFRQRRIPIDRRRTWPVLENGKEIVWVRGFPPASSAAASPESGEVFIIKEKRIPDRGPLGELK